MAAEKLMFMFYVREVDSKNKGRRAGDPKRGTTLRKPRPDPGSAELRIGNLPGDWPTVDDNGNAIVAIAAGPLTGTRNYSNGTGGRGVALTDEYIVLGRDGKLTTHTHAEFRVKFPDVVLAEQQSVQVRADFADTRDGFDQTSHAQPTGSDADEKGNPEKERNLRSPQAERVARIGEDPSISAEERERRRQAGNAAALPAGDGRLSKPAPSVSRPVVDPAISADERERRRLAGLGELSETDSRLSKPAPSVSRPVAGPGDPKP